MENRDLRAVGDRIEELVGALGASPDPRAREQGEELVRLLMEIYGAGLARVVELAPELGERLADDPLVASLLVLHGLHPLDTDTRIRKALDGVRPYLGSHGGGVHFVGVENDVAMLRLEGSCDGCPSSTVTVKLAIEKALLEAAPEISRVHVENVTEPAPASPLLQIQRRKGSPPGAALGPGEWIRLGSAPLFDGSDVAAVDVAGQRVVVCRVGESLYAYRDACACGSLLATASLHEGLLTCPTCARRFDLKAAGRCLDDAARHLEPLPLLDESGTVRIAVPMALGAA